MKYKNIILRPMKESDLADEERWHTIETEWGEWDAPWEEDDPIDIHMERERKYLEKIQREPPEIYGVLEIDTIEGRHIGGVNRYYIDGVKDLLAVGICIPPVYARGRGYGKNALVLWIAYHFASSYVDEIYTQTWSGNYPMIRLAESIGFEEIGRIKGIRKVHGGRYDALTFCISKEKFYKNHTDGVLLTPCVFE